MSEAFYIRSIDLRDAAQAAKLSAQLGYPIEPEAMEANIAQLHASTDRVAYVACLEERILGWMEVAIVQHLVSAQSGEIVGLIVAEGERSRGVGAALLSRAEQWMREQGVSRVVVRSRISRERAHHFYLKHGFTEWKRSLVFTKDF